MSPSKKIVNLVKKCMKLSPSAGAPHHHHEGSKSLSSRSYSSFRQRSSSCELDSPVTSRTSWESDSPGSWRNYDSDLSEESDPCPWDVPEGCLAVYVGGERRRFVIQTELLHHSLFRALLAKSEEEFGFENQGGLRIACEPDMFERLLWRLEADSSAVNWTLENKKHLKERKNQLWFLLPKSWKKY
jgi:SAUR family protein